MPNPGDFGLIQVSDTGQGIAPEYLERIFDPFFTTKKVGKGSGIGLTIAHTIIHEHDGALLAESTPGQGSVFSVYQPIHPPTNS